MQNTMLLESIWQGDICPSKCARNDEIIRLLGFVLPLGFVHFTARSGVTRSCIVSENVELHPEIYLGDVLAEELDANVPYGSMIVIFQERGRGGSLSRVSISHELGMLIGDLLVNLIQDCVFPIECELEVLSVMANSYCQLIDSPDFQRHNVCSRSFHKGLSVSLTAYCEGLPDCKLEGGFSLLQSANNASYVMAHLTSVEPHVGKNMFRPKGINLTKLHGNVLSGNDWKKSISEAVMGEIRKKPASTRRSYR